MASADNNAEREVDLARWRRSVATHWWIPVAGIILGAILGVLFSLRGSTSYSATALISLGQPVSPGGTVINGFGQNPRAISEITSSADAQAQAAKRADMHAGALRGHVSIAQVGTATGSGSARATPLISLTVTGRHEIDTAAAANALADIVVEKTTANYVGTKIRTFQVTLDHVDVQITSVNKLLAATLVAEKAAKSLDPLQQLVVVNEEDNAETRLGNLIAQQETLQQQLAFAKTVESAEVVDRAVASQTSARSKTSSLVIGALIGLLIGAFVAIAGDGRWLRARSA
jgi:hypothetical protein